MIKLLIVLVALVAILFVLWLAGMLAIEAFSTLRDKLFPKQVPVEKPKAIEKPEEIIDWTDIQWNVQKKMPDEQR